MSPSVAAVAGGVVTALYVPTLRQQIRDGEISIPFGTINPIRISRADHPIAFRVGAIVMGTSVALLLTACVAIVIRSFLR